MVDFFHAEFLRYEHLVVSRANCLRCPACVLRLICHYAVVTEIEHFNAIVATEKFRVFFSPPRDLFFSCRGIRIELRPGSNPLVLVAYGGGPISISLSSHQLRIMIQEDRFLKFLQWQIFLDREDDEDAQDDEELSAEKRALCENLAVQLQQNCASEYARVCATVDCVL